MEENIYLTNLYDYYRNLFTPKQQHYFEDYYFDNLSLSEISENYNVSRNAVSKQLLSIKEKLYEYEDTLKLWHNKENISKIVTAEILEKIEDYI